METSSDPSDSLHLRLEGFKGPLDLLLDLARLQKVALARISIAALAEQFLAVIKSAALIRRVAGHGDVAVLTESRLLTPAPQTWPEDLQPPHKGNKADAT